MFRSRAWILLGVGLGTVAFFAIRARTAAQSKPRVIEPGWDEIDQSSDESFPASDAPSWTPERV